MSTETVAAPQDARHVPLSTADKLEQDAQQAARVRALSNHPDVIALRVERVRTQIDRMTWVGIFLGLAFTMVNVQGFAAAGAVVGTLSWCAAWLLDPMVSIVLVAVLRAEQITARYQVLDGMEWAHRTKWFAFAATYAMNTWRSWAVLDVAGIVLHSVPPALVFLAAETAPVLRDRLTEAVMRAADMATGTAPAAPDAAHAAVSTEAVNAATETTPGDVAPVTVPAAVRRAPRKAPARKPAGRKQPGRAGAGSCGRTTWPRRAPPTRRESRSPRRGCGR